MIQFQQPSCNKKGLAWVTIRDVGDWDKLAMTGLWHVWNSRLSFPINNTPGLVPMLWGRYNTAGADLVARMLQDIPQDYSDYIIFLNEGDLHDQANMSPQDAADLFQEVCKLYPLAKWVGPNASDADIGGQSNWLKQFLGAINKMGLTWRMRRVGFHWYDQPVDGLKDVGPAIDRLYAILADYGMSDRLAWCTEIGSNRNWGSTPKNLERWLRQLTQDPRIERYFVFTNRGDDFSGRDYGLIDASGNLLDTGIVVREA